MTFTICSPCVFWKIYPRWCFAKCCFHCSQKFQCVCVSLSCVWPSVPSQMFPPCICSQCSHLAYFYIPYVLQNAPNPVPNKPQILSHNLCLKCSLTLSIWHRMWYNSKNHKFIYQKSSNVAKKIQIYDYLQLYELQLYDYFRNHWIWDQFFLKILKIVCNFHTNKTLNPWNI
jgi:hypothetical protein